MSGGAFSNAAMSGRNGGASLDSERSNYVRKIRRKRRVKWALCYVGPDGRRHSETTEAPTREAAKLLLAKKVRDLIEQKVSGLATQPALTFEEFAKKYLAHQASAVEKRSYERNEAMIHNQFLPAFGKRKLADIRPRDIQEYLNERAQTVYKRMNGTTKKIAPATVDREYQTLKGMFSRAIDWDCALVNPVKKVKLRKYEWRKQRILALDEQERLFGAFQLNDRRKYLADIVTVALHTGMREDEILRLPWADVDFSTKKIIVRSTNENPNKGKRTRPIDMSGKVQAVMARLYMAALKACKGDPLAVQKRYVFVNPRTGTRYKDTKIGWYASLKDAKIAGLRFHDLRHSFATRAVQGGCKLPALQQVLGHRDITTTMRYVHMLGVDLNDVVDCVESFESKQGGVTPKMEAALG